MWTMGTLTDKIAGNSYPWPWLMARTVFRGNAASADSDQVMTTHQKSIFSD